MPFSVLQHRALDDAAGGLLGDVDIRVRHETPALPLASLYTDRDGSSVLSNPTIGGFFSDGKIRCYLAAGRYRVELLVDSVVVDTFYDVAVGTSQETDNTDARSGLFFRWDTGTSDADPGAGKIRASNASLASAAFLYVDDLSNGGDNVESYLLTLDDSTNGVKGALIITDPVTGNQATLNVSGVTDASGYAKIAVGNHSGATSFDNLSLVTFQFMRAGDTGTSGGGVTKNHIINGDFQVWQRGTSFHAGSAPANNDAAYLADRWKILSDGNDTIDVTRETSVIPSNGLYAISLDVETVNRKFGIWQVIEQRNCLGLIGQTVTLSFKAKVSSTTKFDNLKAAIVAWDGTADAPTADPISAWNVEGTNPTLVANYTYENTPANLNPTTSYATYSVGAAIDTASCKNIAVMIWSDVTDTTLGDFLYITDVQLEIGSSPTAFARQSAQEILADCQRYYYRRASAGTTDYIAVLQAFSTSAAVGKLIDLPVFMRSVPTVAVSSAAHISAVNADASAANAFGASSFTTSSQQSISGTLSSGSGLVAGNATGVRFNTAAGYIEASAEL